MTRFTEGLVHLRCTVPAADPHYHIVIANPDYPFQLLRHLHNIVCGDKQQQMGLIQKTVAQALPKAAVKPVSQIPLLL